MANWSAEHRITIAIIIGIACGITIGVLLKYFTKQPWSDREIMYLQYPGELFLRINKCLILPMIISTVVSANCHLSKSGSIGLKALYYYITTTTLGITLCILLTQTIKPGTYHSNNNMITDSTATRKFVTIDTYLDLLRNLIPDNLVNVCFNQYQTVLLKPLNSTDDNVHQWEISHHLIDETNVLGLILISMLMGIAIGYLNEEGKPLLNFFQALSESTTLIMNRIIIAVPFVVLFLIPGKILETKDMAKMISQMSIYVFTVLLGLLIHGLIILPSLYFICTRQSPFHLFRKMGPALMTAIGTSSSTATVPMTIRCLNLIGINLKVSKFIVPIGATINMDGIALYETMGALFIIQQRNLNYSFARIIAIAITCTVSCIGAAGLPNGGYVMLIPVLASIGIPAEDVTFIIAIDCFVDRLRTTINIIADVIGAAIIDHFTREENYDIEEESHEIELRPMVAFNNSTQLQL